MTARFLFINPFAYTQYLLVSLGIDANGYERRNNSSRDSPRYFKPNSIQKCVEMLSFDLAVTPRLNFAVHILV